MQVEKWPDGLPRSANQKFSRLKSVSPWFEIYQVNEQTFAILEPKHDEEVFSYLVLGSNKAVLIDTGMGIASIKDEVKQLTDLPILVINTHSHFDHTGGNHQFTRISCFNDAWEENNINQGHSNEFCRNFMNQGSYIDLPADFDAKHYFIRPSSLTQKLNHLDSIELGERTLIIHHTPGHSPGSICIEDKRDKILFTGDTFYAGSIFAHLPGSNKDDFFRSAAYLAGLCGQINFLCPGHNEVYASPERLIDLWHACRDIIKGRAGYEINQQSCFYSFEWFNLRLPLLETGPKTK